MKTKDVKVLHTVLMIFLFAAPLCASAFEKTITVYASMGLFAIAVGYRIFKGGRIVLTRSCLLFTAMSVYSFLQLIWVSDKGSQCALSALFLATGAVSLLIADYKKLIGSENLQSTALRLIYSATLFYTVMAILHQIFIESKFLDCSMCFTAGSSATSAFIAVMGIVVTIKLFGKNKRSAAFYVAMPLMGYMLIMSKSVIGYLFAMGVAFAWAMTRKHRKAEAFGALTGCVILGVINAINAVAVLFKNPGYFNGAVKGIVSIFGVGSGGYNAAAAVVDKGYEGAVTTFNLLLEAHGVIGLAFMVLLVMTGVARYRRERGFRNILMLMFTVGVILSSSATLAFTLPLIGMYYASCDEGVEIYAHKAVAFVLAVPIAFSALFTFAHIPYALGKHQCDLGNNSKGGAFYAAGATMELINAHGWEKAYKAYMKSDEASCLMKTELIEKAIRFNKKNYAYYRDMAEAYTAEGDYLKALEIWEDIIARHDKEYLYPMYGEKILDVMEYCPVGLEKMEELYLRLDTYAKKSEDKNIIFEMNNILARSQQYYVNVREGGKIAGDMYVDTDSVTEVEYESSSAEG